MLKEYLFYLQQRAKCLEILSVLLTSNQKSGYVAITSFDLSDKPFRMGPTIFCRLDFFIY